MNNTSHQGQATPEPTLVGRIAHYERLSRRYESRFDRQGRHLWLAYRLQTSKHRYQLTLHSDQACTADDRDLSLPKPRGLVLTLMREAEELEELVDAMNPNHAARTRVLAGWLNHHLEQRSCLVKRLGQHRVVF